MIGFALAWDKIRARPLAAFTTAVSFALAVALLSVLLSLRVAVDRGMDDLAGLCDLIVGPKGGSTDLFLSAGLGVAPPRGRVDADIVRDLEADYRVARVAPVRLDDDYQGWHVIATTASYSIFATDDQLGEYFKLGNRVAIVGQVAARALGLQPGDTFVTSHGVIEGDAPYDVVEILGTRTAAADRTIFVPLESARHEENDDTGLQANAALVTLKASNDILPMLREINDLRYATAVDPRAEASRLRQVIGGADRYLWAAGIAVLALSTLSIAAVMVSQADERRRECAILRALGASFGHVLASEAAHALVLSLAGSTLGLIAGVALSVGLGLKGGWVSGDLVSRGEILMALASVALGILVALAASLPLYRIDLDEALRPEK